MNGFEDDRRGELRFAFSDATGRFAVFEDDRRGELCFAFSMMLSVDLQHLKMTEEENCVRIGDRMNLFCILKK